MPQLEECVRACGVLVALLADTARHAAQQLRGSDSAPEQPSADGHPPGQIGQSSSPAAEAASLGEELHEAVGALQTVRQAAAQSQSAAERRQATQAALPQAARVAQLLERWFELPQQAAGVRLLLAQAAASRACAYLGCANLGGGGGPFAGEGQGSQRCSACRAVW